MVSDQQELLSHADLIARICDAVLPKGVGYVLLVFDPTDDGAMSYATSGERDDVKDAVEEYLRLVEEGRERMVDDDRSPGAD